MTKMILLAEDSPDDEFTFRRVLQSAGVQNPITAVRDGADAVAYLKGEGQYADRDAFPLPSIVFLDLKMQRMDGGDVLKWLKRQRRFNKTLVVVLTHLEEAKELYEAYSLGANSFLVKPLTRVDMEDLIQHFPGYWTCAPAAPSRRKHLLPALKEEPVGAH